MKRLMPIFLFAVLLLAFSSPAAAQDHPAKFVLMATMTVKPEAVSEYEDYVKKIQAAANKIGAPQQVLVYQQSGSYNFVLPFNKGDEVAGWPDELLREAYGEAEARHIEESSRECITKREFRMLRYRPDLSRPIARVAPRSK